jgi:hypothetical protein
MPVSFRFFEVLNVKSISATQLHLGDNQELSLSSARVARSERQGKVGPKSDVLKFTNSAKELASKLKFISRLPPRS